MALIVVFLIASLVGAPPIVSAAPGNSRFTAEWLRQDLEFVKQMISENHPDHAFSADTDLLDVTYHVLHSSVHAEMTRDDAWAWLAKLNPVLADGHLFVGYPDWRGSTVAYLKSSGGQWRLSASDLLLHQTRRDGQLYYDGNTLNDRMTFMPWQAVVRLQYEASL